jgi:hypothetical protein
MGFGTQETKKEIIIDPDYCTGLFLGWARGKVKV